MVGDKQRIVEEKVCVYKMGSVERPGQNDDNTSTEFCIDYTNYLSCLLTETPFIVC